MTYTVKVGDTLNSIATKFLGDKNKVKEILALNPTIKDANKIYPNQKIFIPDLPYPANTNPPLKPQSIIQKPIEESGVLDKLKAIFKDKKVAFGFIILAGAYFLLKKKK